MGQARRIGGRHNEDVEDIDGQDDQDTDEQDTSEDSEQDENSEQEQEQPAGKREAKYRKQRNAARAQLRKAQQELAALKANPKDDKRARRVQREAAEELAFVKAAAAEGVQDVEAAWKLCDRDLLTWKEDDDDGPRLSGVEDALEHVLDRYPYIAGDGMGGRAGAGTGGNDDEDEDDDRVQPPGATTSGRATNGPRKGHKQLDRAYLATKYPALSRRPRRSPFG